MAKVEVESGNRRVTLNLRSIAEESIPQKGGGVSELSSAMLRTQNLNSTSPMTARSRGLSFNRSPSIYVEAT